MGGEKSSMSRLFSRYAGSPPHGRGKVAGAACRDLLGGITPALAGKSMTAPGRSSRTGDHPRVGGEKPAQQGVEPPCMGSPPHGRGKVRGRKPFLQEPWITPAWAGKRAQHAARDLPFQDHPRVGGEKRQKSPPRPARQGSPPHGRGKDFHELHGVLLAGITPAWAGKRAGGAMKSPRNRDHPRMGGEKPKVL